MSKQPYFPNNWQAYKDMPAEDYQCHSYEDVMEHKVHSWELPSSIVCVIRARDTRTLKTDEYVYRRAAAANKKIEELIAKNPHHLELIVADEATVSMMRSPKAQQSEEDEDWDNED